MGGGNSQTTSSSQNSDPWGPQADHLTGAWDAGRGILKGLMKDGQYSGDMVAAPDAASMDLFRQMMGYGAGGMQTGQGMTATGVGTAAQGTAGAASAAGGLFGMAGSDPTAQHLATAGQYADNPHISGMVDAAMVDGRRELNEQIIPGIDRSAAATGNMNSTRGGIAQGIAERGLAEKAQGLSAAMRGDAWTKGLGMAGANSDRQLAALTGAGGLYGDLAKTGLYGAGLGSEIGTAGANVAGSGATGVAAGNQSILDNLIAKDGYKVDRSFAPLNNYANIVQAGNWGGTTSGTSTQTQKPSTMSTIGSGVSILGSLFKLCDARLKVVHGTAGKTREGLPLFLISYRDAPHLGLHVTPMAQDVQARFPEAVSEINGVLVIDTSKYDWR